MDKKPITYEAALARTAALCSQGEQCAHALREKMTRWLLPEEDQARVLAYLRKEKYLNEGRYARAYCHDRLRYNHWGRQKIRLMLRAQRLAEADITAALDDIDPEEYRQVLRDTLASKARTLTARTDYERRGKLIRFAVGRGFEMDEVMREVE